ncbi:DUF6339 family protein [Planctomycetaceae bacterium]|nr:DUF6339 family protein [Planctomycetaceae bacterium]
MPILQESYLGHLDSQVRKSSVQATYRGKEPFPLDRARLITRTHLPPESELPVLTCNGGTTSQQLAATDATNAIELYQSLQPLDGDRRRPLTTVEASDRRLWAYMTHGPYLDYCRERFPKRHEDSDKYMGYIRDHWFFRRGRLRRNAVSRLWWAAHLTVCPWKADPELEFLTTEDQFYYTRILTKVQDIYQGIVERDFGRSLKVRILILDVLDRFQDRGVSLTDLCLEIFKRVNIISKHRDLGSIPAESLLPLIEELAERVVSAQSADS